MNDLEDKKININEVKEKKNINKKLNELMALNMPDGGVDIESFMQISPKIIALNNSLIDLLVNGIIPMNNLNVYHCDIKDTNVLVDQINLPIKTRLIDWGLSIHHINNKGIPRKLYRRPFQYNVPFSVILFNKEFTKNYNEFLEINPQPDYFLIREFVINYIFIWNNIRGPGHLKAINDILKKLTINGLTAIKKKKVKNHMIEYEFTYYYIVEYISEILYKFTTNGKFDLLGYFNKIFLKTVDIWGFVMIYLSIFEQIHSRSKNMNKYHIELLNKIKYIIIHFLYESPTQPINTDDLVIELTNLDKVFQFINYSGGDTRTIKMKNTRKQINYNNKTRKI